MALYAIADLHLSLGTNKPMDIFSGWEGYTEKLERNWRSVVTNDDTVVIVGDISWAMKLEQIDKDFAFLHSLPGKKILIKGNHDYWWTTKSKIETYIRDHAFASISILFNCAESVDGVAICGTRGWFYDCDTDGDVKILNREIGRLTTSIECAKKLSGEPIAFLHYPPVYGTYECQEIIKVLENYGINKCYYGHIHGSYAVRKAITGEHRGINFTFVACDYTNFTPILVK